MLVSTILRAASDELNDADPQYPNVRWANTMLLDYLSEAVATIASLKPNMFLATVTMDLRAGSVQVLPVGYSMVNDVVSVRDKVTGQISFVNVTNYQIQKLFNKPQCAENTLVNSASLDPSRGNIFIVSPAPTSDGQQVATVIAQATPPTLVLNGEVNFPSGNVELYRAPMLDWVLYRAFSKDTESETSMIRATAHYKAFYDFMRVKVTADSLGQFQRRTKASKVERDDA